MHPAGKKSQILSMHTAGPQDEPTDPGKTRARVGEERVRDQEGDGHIRPGRGWNWQHQHLSYPNPFASPEPPTWINVD